MGLIYIPLAMKLNVHIREATIKDSEAVAHVQVDSYRSAYAGILPSVYLDHFTYEEQTQDWRNLLAQSDHDLLIVAEIASGEIVGYALGRPDPGTITPYNSELVALHVRQPYQRRGVGRRLVATMAARLRQQGCSSLMLWVLAENPARAFYQRLGGLLIGQRQIQLGEGEIAAVEVAYGWPDITSLCG